MLGPRDKSIVIENRVIERVRKRLSETDDGKLPGDDIEFKDLVEEEALKEEEMSVAELRCVIDNIFMKLRSKLGAITGLVEDEEINEIMVNGPDNVFVEDRNGIRKTAIKFGSEDELQEVIRNIASKVHREINEMNPILDARLSNGSRVNAVFGNVAQGGPVLTVRKFGKKRITMDQMIRGGTVTCDAADVLGLLVKTGHNILISGGTSSGKTTFLNALTDYIPKDERVIVIEDSRELNFDHIGNMIQMECHTANSQGNGEISMDMLIRTSLRMRPDRIIVGEVRGREVAMMLQAMNTGHDGSLTTGHGNSPSGMLRRLEAMYLMSEEIPLEAIRSQILEGIDIMVHLKRLASGKRVVTEISELVGYDSVQGYIINPLFTAGKDMSCEATGNRLYNRRKLIMCGN